MKMSTKLMEDVKNMIDAIEHDQKNQAQVVDDLLTMYSNLAVIEADGDREVGE